MITVDRGIDAGQINPGRPQFSSVGSFHTARCGTTSRTVCGMVPGQADLLGCLFRIQGCGTSQLARGLLPVVIVKFRDLMITAGGTRLMFGYPCPFLVIASSLDTLEVHSRIGAPSEVLFPETPKT